MSCAVPGCAQNYLQELENPAAAIYNKSSLDRTMMVAYNNTR